MTISKQQAQDLLSNPAFIDLMNSERIDALEMLAQCDASSTIDILRQQQRIAVIDSFRFALESLTYEQDVNEAP